MDPPSALSVVEVEDTTVVVFDAAVVEEVEEAENRVGEDTVVLVLDGDDDVADACPPSSSCLALPSRGEEGCRGEAEIEGDSNKLDLLHGGDFSKSKRSSIPRLAAMSKYCPSTRYVALNALHTQLTITLMKQLP